MEHRQLGRSGFFVPALSFGTGTFGGKGGLQGWGSTQAAEATRIVDVCLEHGITMFDSADIYSGGASEEVLGAAIKGRRNKVLISTKATFRSGADANDVGSSRFHLTRAVEAALKRLGTDHIDLFQLHGYDAKTPPEEVLSTLDTLIRAGKIGYIGVSNFSGWHLMKALATADRYGLPRFVANQTYYSLIGRDYEWELMPLGLDQGVGAVVWSPLGLGTPDRQDPPRREAARSQPPAHDGRFRPAGGRRASSSASSMRSTRSRRRRARPCRRSRSTGCCSGRPCRPSSSARATRSSCKDNLGAIGWNLTPEQVKTLDKASAVTLAYPYWHQKQFKERNPFPTRV